MAIRPRVKTIEVSRRENDRVDYLVLNLHFDIVNQFVGILTLKKDDADKMNVRVGWDVVIRMRSAKYGVTPEEREEERKQMEHNPALAKLHWAKVQAKIIEMQERYAAPDASWSKVGYQPYKYYSTAFNWTDDVGMALLPIQKDWAIKGEISVGDLVSLEVTTPLK